MSLLDRAKELWLSSGIQKLLDGFTLNGDYSTQYGQLGDYIGGVWGTVISVVTLVIVYITWISTQKFARLQTITVFLIEMLKTHDTISQSGEFSFWDRRGTPSILLREFAALYRITRRIVPSDDQWSIDDRIDISYTFAYYGLNIQSYHSLSQYGREYIKAVSDSASKLRNRSKSKYRDMFKGHQYKLSHYNRNLFGMYNLIDNSDLDISEKHKLSKIIRTKLSNYDQALLALNVMSHLGREWEDCGFTAKYRPFGNIPEKFFGFDKNFDILHRFPTVFFEWEAPIKKRPLYRTRNVGPIRIITQGREFVAVKIKTGNKI
ncbi:putative phage abortive infection protein [Ancylobacter sp.]|uniref:putative phage abortive infection protein n=1 Tax=Ancylobacter sp. TaxID=1872567 RepID=UPI003BADA7B3